MSKVWLSKVWVRRAPVDTGRRREISPVEERPGTGDVRGAVLVI